MDVSVTEEGTFENGKKVSWVQKENNDNGQLSFKGTSKDGKIDGP